MVKYGAEVELKVERSIGISIMEMSVPLRHTI